MKKKTKQLETAAAAPEAPEQIEKREWLAIRKKAGRKIDPETAEIIWEYGYALDPYGIRPDLSPACRQFQTNYFARSPGSDIWVFFYDLPPATRHALWEKHGAKLAFRLQDEETRALRAQREKLFREKIKAMEFLYDWLESGKSFEEVEFELDIRAAGGALSESSHEVWRGGLEVIRKAYEEGADRNEVITFLQESEKADLDAEDPQCC